MIGAERKSTVVASTGENIITLIAFDVNDAVKRQGECSLSWSITQYIPMAREEGTRDNIFFLVIHSRIITQTGLLSIRAVNRCFHEKLFGNWMRAPDSRRKADLTGHDGFLGIMYHFMQYHISSIVMD